MKSKIKDLLAKMPYIRFLHDEINRLKSQLKTYKKDMMFPPGHYYSPIISVNKIKNDEERIWKQDLPDTIPGIDLNTDYQLQLISELSNYYSELPFKAQPQEGLRYYFENDYYSYTDAIILYAMLRHFKPKRVIEVGSGFSSALMIDTNELFFNGAIQLEFIEPNPKRLYSLFSKSDKENIKVTEDLVQNIPLSTFRKLQAGDILFIDSSHVAKTGSDLNYILFDILPNLNTGVIIHFHDIFFPFEYPKEWVYAGRNWNENYILRAFLMHNTEYKIIHFSDYLHQNYPEVFKKMPLAYKNTGGALWMEKKSS